MRYTRFQWSRMFLNMAILVHPDGDPKGFLALLVAHDEIMRQIKAIKDDQL